MYRAYFEASLAITLLFVVIAASSCTMMRTLISPVIPKGPELKKKVMVFPLVDQARLGEKRAKKLNKDFEEFLKRSPDLLLFTPPEGAFSSLAMTSPLFGVVTSSKLVDIAEGLGMNALVIGVINPIEVTTRKSGIWPFRSYKKFYEISMGVNIIDIATKTFSMTRIASEEFSISLDEAEKKDKKEITNEALKEALPEILEEQAAAVEKELARNPWTGRILAVEDNTIMIDAGNKVGVRPGQTFEVLSEGKSIPSGSGRSIRLLGNRVGEIKVTSVMGKHSLAVAVDGGEFSAGQVVRSIR